MGELYRNRFVDLGENYSAINLGFLKIPNPARYLRAQI
jgi:hypothetical protein